MDWSRRKFNRVAFAGAAWGMTGPARAQNPHTGRTLNFAIVGLGRISLDHFLPGLLQTKYCRPAALVSGHRAKAEKYAAQYGIPQTHIYNYQNFDRIATDPSIDAVYIALPNSMHAEFTIRAAKAGKHVLCEKPMATSVADAQAMVDACAAARRKLMIAYRCQYDPIHLRAVELIRSGKIGQVQAISSGFGFNIPAGEWRLERALAGGGPLVDVGIYSLNACRFLTGEEPVEVKGYSSVIDQDGRFQEVEENLTWTMRFPSGAVASCSTSYGASLTGYYRVYGSKGTIYVEPAFNYDGLRLAARLADESNVTEATQRPDPAQFPPQADHLAECVFENKTPKTPGEEGLRDQKLMEAIYRSCPKA